MNKELQAIENSIMQWTFYVVTGAKNKWSYEPIRDANLLDNCYLCEHSSGITGTRECRDFSDDSRHPRCQACPYFKKYGFCCDSGKPVEMWADDHNPMHAQAFLDQLKVLAYEAQHPEPKKAEKPKLRHGDYGRDLDGFIYLEDNIRHKSIVHWLGDYGESGLSGRAAESFEGKVIGNLADDLAALKPIKEFHRPKSHSIGNTEFHVNLCESGDVDFVVGYEYVCFTSKEFSEITLKCRCMELRMIQDAAKQ